MLNLVIFLWLWMMYRITFAVVHSERHKFFLTFVNDESYYDMFLLSRILVTLAKDFSQCHFYDKQLIINDVCKVFGTLIKLLSGYLFNAYLQYLIFYYKRWISKVIQNMMYDRFWYLISKCW